MNRIMKDEYWMLAQDKNGPKLRLFNSEEAARKTAALRPSYPGSGRPLNQGGQLWHLKSGETWVLVEDIPGDYNPKTRGLYL